MQQSYIQKIIETIFFIDVLQNNLFKYLNLL